MPITRKTSKAEEIEKKMALKQKKKPSKEESSEEDSSEESPVLKKKSNVSSKKKKVETSDEESIGSDVELDSSVVKEVEKKEIVNDIEQLISTHRLFLFYCMA